MKTIELPYSEITNIPKIVCHDKGNKSKSKITFINSDKNWYFKTIVDGGVLDNTNGKKCVSGSLKRIRSAKSVKSREDT